MDPNQPLQPTNPTPEDPTPPQPEVIAPPTPVAPTENIPSEVPLPTFVAPPAEPVVPAGNYSNASSNQNYTSNPFLATTEGLTLTLQKNPVPTLVIMPLWGIGFIVFSIIAALARIVAHSTALEMLVILALIISIPIFIGAYLAVAAASAQQTKITTKQAFSAGAKKFFPFLWLDILTGLIIAVGFIFLVVPGLILLARTSLASLVMFEENVGAMEALKRSFALTKGHTNEMLGAITAGGLLGGNGLLGPAISVSPLVSRYHGLKQLQDTNTTKPKVHWLNYIWIAAIVFFALYVGAITAITAHSKPSKTTQPTTFYPSTFNTNSTLNLYQQ